MANHLIPATLLVLMILVPTLPALPIQPSAVGPGAALERTGVHFDDFPTDADYGPLPPVDVGSWYGIPVLRERTDGTPSVPAFLLVDVDVLGIDSADLAARGMTLVSALSVGSWSLPRIVAAAVPEGEAMGVFAASAAASDAPAASSSGYLEVSVHYDQTVALDPGARSVADEAWWQTVDYYGQHEGIPLAVVHFLPGTPDVKTLCQLNLAAMNEMQFAHHGEGLVVFSAGTIEGSFGVALDYSSVLPYSRGQSPNWCGVASPWPGADWITPAVIPSMYASTSLSQKIPTVTDTRTGTAFVAAHEFAHFLGMEHGMARCDNAASGWSGASPHAFGFHKTLESFTGADDTPDSCSSNANPQSHYHWRLNALGGSPRVRNEWTALQTCLGAGWCGWGSPSAVAALRAVGGDGQVTLSFDGPAHQGGTPIAGYCYYMDMTRPDFLKDVPDACWNDPSARTRTVQGLVNGVAHHFYVRAFNSNGAWWEGPRSDHVTATPAPAAARPPSAPTLDSALAGNGQVTLVWSAPSDDGGSPITSYRMHRDGVSIGAGACSNLDGNARSCTDTGLQNGRSYSYVVTAANGAGDSPPSNARAATPTAPPSPPAAPSLDSATPGNQQVSLAWSAPPSDGGSAITGYRVSRDGVLVVAGSCSNLGENARSCTDAGLTNGQTYSFQVSAVNAVGNGAWSTPRSATPVAPNTVPSAPTLNSAVPGNSEVQLSWSAPTSDGGSTISAYRVYRDGTLVTGGGCSGLAGASRSCTDSGLANGQSYRYEVTAVNGLGEGARSNALSATPAAAPGAPTLQSVTTGNAQLTLSWAAPSTDGGSAVTSYRVYRDGNLVASGGCSGLGGTARSCTDGGRTNGQQYWYHVSAVNAVGEGTTSNTLSGTPRPPNRAPPVPANPWPADGATGITTAPPLSWTAVADPDGDAVRYNVYLDSEHPPVPRSGCQDLSAASCTLTGLLPSTLYHWGVIACDTLGACSSMADWHFTTLSPPANDDFDGATGMTSTTPSSQTQATAGAGMQPGEPAFACASQGRATVWFTFTPPYAGLYSFSTSGSAFDTVLAVHTGPSLGALNTLGCDDDGWGSQSRLVLGLRGLTTYRIQVGGWNGDTGRLDLAVSKINTGGYPADSTDCVPETSPCSFSGTKDVLYGNDHGVWIVKTGRTGSITCSNTVMGTDPDPGWSKRCRTRASNGAGANPAGYTECAVEGQVCYTSGTKEVIYGTTGGTYVLLTGVQGEVACTNEAFGWDPHSGEQKRCFYR